MKNFVLSSAIICACLLGNSRSSNGQGCTPTSGANPTAATSIFAAGPPAWASASSAEVVDGVYSTAGAILNLGPSTSQTLQLTGFGFNIPAGSNICGIAATLTRVGASVLNVTTAAPGTTIADNSVVLVSSPASVMAVTSTNQAISTPWVLAPTTVTYGGPTNTWGNTWTTTDINDPSFGFEISAAFTATLLGLLPGAYVDGVSIIVYYSPVSLPITLTSWSVVRQGSADQLSWDAAVTDLPGEFIVEHSSNGTDWSTLTTVPAPLDQSAYSYLDQQPYPSGPTYYRLRLHSDGEADTYSTVAVVAAGSTPPAISLYPNPFHDMINITASHAFSTVSLKDVQGRTLWMHEYGNSGGSNTSGSATSGNTVTGVTTAQIPASNLPAGLYFVQIDGATYKLIKN